jgi:hypothetical protein
LPRFNPEGLPVKQYFVPALVFATVLAASPVPLPARAGDVPEHRMADARAAHSRHPAEEILIETLDLDSDFRIFMEPGCPEPVRRRALRRLWSLFPPAEEGSPWN